MDLFLVKTEHSKTEHKKRQRAVVRDDDDAFERPHHFRRVRTTSKSVS